MALLHWLLCIDLARVCACVFECVHVCSLTPVSLPHFFYGLSRKIVVKTRGLIYKACACTKRGWNVRTPLSTQRLWFTKNKLDGRMCGLPRKLWPSRRPTHILETVGIGDTDDRTVVRLQTLSVGRTITLNIYIFCFPHTRFFHSVSSLSWRLNPAVLFVLVLNDNCSINTLYNPTQILNQNSALFHYQIVHYGSAWGGCPDCMEYTG